MALTLRPVLTPANNLAMFKERQRAARDARKAELGLLSPTTKGMMKPGGKQTIVRDIRAPLMSSSRFRGAKHLCPNLARITIASFRRTRLCTPPSREDLS